MASMQMGVHDSASARRVEVARLYCEGWYQRQIAAKLGVTQQQICKDLKIIRRTWREQMADHYESLRATEYGKLLAIERAAWRAWRRSTKDVQRKYAKMVTTPDGPRQESGKTEEGQYGDPRFLTEARACSAERRRLMGMDVQKDGPPPSGEVVVRVLGPGVSMTDLHGGTVFGGRQALNGG